MSTLSTDSHLIAENLYRHLLENAIVRIDWYALPAHLHTTAPCIHILTRSTMLSVNKAQLIIIGEPKRWHGYCWIPENNIQLIPLWQLRELPSQITSAH